MPADVDAVARRGDAVTGAACVERDGLDADAARELDEHLRAGAEVDDVGDGALQPHAAVADRGSESTFSGLIETVTSPAAGLPSWLPVGTTTWPPAAIPAAVAWAASRLAVPMNPATKALAGCS